MTLRVPPADALMVVAVLALVSGLGACGGTGTAAQPPRSATTSTAAPSTGASRGVGPTNPCGATTSSPTSYDHVIWIWMENHTASQVIGSGDAPYTTMLANRCATAAHYASVGSPSLPNYIGATSGDNQGIGDDDGPSSHPLVVNNLFRQVRASGKTERSYEESMLANCQLDSGGEYAVKHKPASYYADAQDRAACQHDDVPLGTLATGALRHDLDTSTLPSFSFVTPNLVLGYPRLFGVQRRPVLVAVDTFDCEKPPVSAGTRGRVRRVGRAHPDATGCGEPVHPDGRG